MGDAPQILVIDDQRDIRDMLTTGLRSAGYVVATASDGEEGLLIAETLTPKLIILDVMMPIMSGWEVLRELKQHPALAGIKVIVLTAIGENVGETTSELYGADLHFDKPFAFTELLRGVSSLIGPP